MNDLNEDRMPSAWFAVRERSAALGFPMPSDSRTGAFLSALAASKPGGRILELGTGTGLATACLLAGMDRASRLISLDQDDRCLEVALAELGDDSRLTFVQQDIDVWLDQVGPETFDLIFADAWPGKYSRLTQTLELLGPGGIYLVDDMLPQANWPDGHAQVVAAWLEQLTGLPGFAVVRMGWSTGLVLLTRTAL